MGNQRAEEHAWKRHAGKLLLKTVAQLGAEETAIMVLVVLLCRTIQSLHAAAQGRCDMEESATIQ